MKRLISELKECIYDIKIRQVILIILCLTVIPSYVGYNAYVISVNRIANEQKKQEELKEKQEKLKEKQAADDITVKYKLALQAKEKKDWNKVITILNTIDMAMVEKNVEEFRVKYEISRSKPLKEAIYYEKRRNSLFMSKEKKKMVEEKCDKLLEIKPITNYQIIILKQFAEGMIEFEKGNYKMADDIFHGIHNIIESDIVDDYNKIIKETRQLLAVQVPVKIVDASCKMKYDNHFQTEIPYFVLTIENPLDEPVHVWNLVERAIDIDGKYVSYTYPPETYNYHNTSLEIPARTKITYKYQGSVFLHGIKYYLIGIDNFYMKNSKKRYKEIEKYTDVKYFKVEAEY